MKALLSSLIAYPKQAAFAVVAAMLATVAPVGAGTLLFHASMPGQQTLDQGEGGGNPFASAFIEALEAPIALAELPTRMRHLTAKKSRGFQSADVPASVGQSFALVPMASGERRIALVMVVSDYAATKGAQSLPGARHDAERVSRALRQAGFQTEQAIDLDLRGMRERLASFRSESRAADVALIYTTGHGVEVDGTVFLLPGDYPIEKRNSALRTSGLSLPEIARAPSAKRANLVLYGGCRDNPFGE